MIDFISAIRTDRAREIKEREKQGIRIYRKKDYRIVDTITVPVAGNVYKFGVQANDMEIYFYIIDNQANTYYDVSELYEILKNIYENGHSSLVIETLKQLLDTESIEEDTDEKDRQVFTYRDVDYYIKKPVFPSYSGMIPMQDGAGDLSYDQLFLLIDLIQEKSNALFRKKSSDPKLEYTDGLVRLLIALITLDEDNDVLGKRGWKYDYDDNRFVLVKDVDENLTDPKYCLTKKEFDSIII